MAQIIPSPHISIVIPFYKNLVFIERLSNSLAEAIKASQFLFEIIVVIDSIENTPNQIEYLFKEAFKIIPHKPELKVLKNEQNIGVAASRNRGIDEAQGTWIHFIDQDDTISSSFYQEFSKYKNLDFVLFNGNFVFENKFKHAIYLLKPSLKLEHFIVNDFIRSPGQVILKRSLTKEVFFRTATCAKGCDDRFFWIEILAKNADLKLAYCSQKIYHAHLHSTNFGSNVIGLYACSLDLWQSIKNLIPKDKQYLVQQNIDLLEFLVNGKRTWTGQKAYFYYQFNFNKILRFIVKRAGLFVYHLKLFKHD
jgi:glycosyltransferase involved in cell wall biosynthesis